MMRDLLWLFWLMVGLACGMQLYRRRNRRRSLARTAASCSLTYTPRDSLDLVGRYSELRLFQQGHDRLVSDVLAGPTPLAPVKIFSYDYDLGFGSDRHPVRWVVGVLETLWDHPPVVLSWPTVDLPQAMPRGFEQPLGIGALSVCGFERVSNELVEALRAWVAGGRDRYHVEFAGRFIALYVRDDGQARAIPQMLMDLDALGWAAEQAVQKPATGHG